jgi:ABC-2 type transport system ATP-binding protein
MKKIVNISNLEFRYKKQVKLLSNFNLVLNSGSINGLLGKNGEGKTTLLKLISGLLFPLHGKISVEGFEPKKRDPKMLKNIFLLPEEIPESNLSIKMYNDVYTPFYPDFSATKFHNYLHEFSIDSGIKSISELSYGQKKKFYIAFGLATNARLILLDEPTNGLDIPSKRQFRRMMASVIDDKCCIVISTHQVLDLEDIVDNVIIMENHDIIFNETTDEINKRLIFNTTENQELTKNLIYSEETSTGYHQVLENKSVEKSKMDLELLFNAVISDHHRIKELFKT